MTRLSDYHLLLSRGRKAGLNASELNSALSVRPVQEAPQAGQTDCNGFVWGVDAHGRRTYQPARREGSAGAGAQPTDNTL